MNQRNVKTVLAIVIVISVVTWVLWGLLALLPTPHSLWLSCILFAAILAPIISALGWAMNTIAGTPEHEEKPKWFE